MSPKQITTTVYTFDELNDKAKEKARDWYRAVSNSDEWWDSIHSDAAEIGLKITGFDTGRNRHATGEFKESARECAQLIVDNHGVDCETHKTAQSFLKERDECVDTATKDENGNFENERELDEKLDAIESEFLRFILEDYSIMLQKELEYIESDENVDENIRANEYTFTETGARFG